MNLYSTPNIPVRISTTTTPLTWVGVVVLVYTTFSFFCFLDLSIHVLARYNGAMKLLVTHRGPDLDAIASLWVLKRFHTQVYGDAKLYFVNAGDSIDLRTAADMGFAIEDVTHVDTGLGEFDHHQEDRGKKRICATSLVIDYVVSIHPELGKDKALQYLSEFVTAIDHFEEQQWPNAADLKNQFMIHSLIEGIRRSGQAPDDEATAHFGFLCLDAAYAGILEQIQAQEDLDTKKQEFSTPWGTGVGIESANDEVVKLAQKSGYVVAVRKDPNKGDIRIKAVPGRGIDLTPIEKKVKQMDSVGRWYFHPGKTMLLNGSSKDSSRLPSPLTLQQIMTLFEQLPKEG